LVPPFLSCFYQNMLFLNFFVKLSVKRKTSSAVIPRPFPAGKGTAALTIPGYKNRARLLLI